MAWWRLCPPANAAGSHPFDLIESALDLGASDNPSSLQSLIVLVNRALVSNTAGTFSVLSLEQAAPSDAPPQTRFSAVLEIRPVPETAEFVRRVDSSFGLDPRAPDSLPGPRSPVTYLRDRWPPWRELSWCRTPDAFDLAVGPGALARWFAAQEGQPPPATSDDWPAHQRAIAQAGLPGTPFFQLYLNLNSLRRCLEPSSTLIDGPGAEILSTLNVSNVRSLMLHARRITPGDVRTRDPVLGLLPPRAGQPPPVYSGPVIAAIDATWSSRSDPPGAIGCTPLTESFWPGDGGKRLHLPPPSGDFVIVLRTDNDRPRGVIDGVLSIAPHLLPADSAANFPVRLADWRKEQHAALQRTLHSFGPWLVLSGAPADRSTIIATLELKQGVDNARMAADLLALVAPLAQRLTADAESSSWSLPFGPPLPEGAAAWTVAGHADRPVLIAAISIGPPPGTGPTGDPGARARAAVRDARESLQEQR